MEPPNSDNFKKVYFFTVKFVPRAFYYFSFFITVILKKELRFQLSLFNFNIQLKLMEPNFTCIIFVYSNFRDFESKLWAVTTILKLGICPFTLWFLHYTRVDGSNGSWTKIHQSDILWGGHMKLSPPPVFSNLCQVKKQKLDYKTCMHVI